MDHHPTTSPTTSPTTRIRTLRLRPLLGLLALLAVIGLWQGGAGASAPTATTTVTGTVAVLADAPVPTTVVRTSSGLVELPERLASRAAPGDVVRLTLSVPDPALSLQRQVADLARGIGAVDSLDVVASAAPSGDLAGQINGTRTLILAPTYVGSLPSIPLSTLEGLAENVSAYYANVTNGGLDLRVQVKPWKKVTSYSDCEFGLYDQALAAHGLSTPTGSTHVAIVLPTACASWAGLATTPGREIWIAADLDPVVLAHEFGHNLGLMHSNLAGCRVALTDAVLSDDCDSNEYGDADDPMGSATRMGVPAHFNAVQLDRLGLVSTTTVSATAPSTTTIQPIQARTGVRAVKIPFDGDHLFVEYRPDVAGLGSPAPSWAGIQVRRSTTIDSKPQLLEVGLDSDLDPWPRIPLDPTGATVLGELANGGTGLALSVSAVGDTATIHLVPRASDATAPTAATLASPANNAVRPSGPVTFSWSRGTDGGSGVAGERLILTPAAGPGVTIPVPAGATTVTVPELDGAYTWKIVTEDRVGRTTSSSSRAFTVDTQPPSPASITSAWDPCTAAAQTVAWDGGSDESSAVTYQLRRDGVLIYSGSGTSVSVNPTTLLSGGSTLSLRTIDAAGNSFESEAFLIADAAPPSAPVGPHHQPTELPTERWLSFASPGANDGSEPTVEFAVDGAPSGAIGTSPQLIGLATAADTVALRSIDTCGNSSPWVTLPLEADDTSAPSAPTLASLAPVQAFQASSVSWGAASDAQSGIAAYEVLVDGTVVTTTNGATTAATIWPSEGANAVTIRAVNGRGASTPSATRILVADATAPTQPTITSPAFGAVVDNPVTVSWEPSTDDGTGLAGYRVIIGTTTLNLGPATTSTTLNLPQDAAITVEAFDAVGNTSSSFTYVSTDGPPGEPGIDGATVAINGPTTVDEGSVQYSLTSTSVAPIGAGRSARISYQPEAGPSRVWLRTLLRPTGGGAFTGSVRLPLRATGTLRVVVEEPSGYTSPAQALAVSVTPAPAPVASTLTGWPTGTRVANPGGTVGATVAVGPGSGRTLRLESRTCSTCAWSLSSTVVTGSNGSAAVTVPVLSGTRDWRVVATATASADAATSGTLTIVPRSTISGWSTTSVSARAGTTVKDGFTLTPVKYRIVKVQYKTCSSCTWRTKTTVKTSGSYTAVAAITVAKGTRYWRVSADAVNGGSSVWSSAKKVVGR